MTIKPIKLSPVRTLNEWFTELPLIYKLDLYNSYSGVITKHLTIKKEDLEICGLCKYYDSDNSMCDKHPTWGEMAEGDTCDDYRESE